VLNVLVPAPADGDAVKVGPAPLATYDDRYELLSIESVRGASVRVNDTLGELTCPYVPSPEMLALTVHVPALTNVTAPEAELIVQTSVVRLVNEVVPLPADGVAVIVGGTATSEYDDV